MQWYEIIFWVLWIVCGGYVLGMVVVTLQEIRTTCHALQAWLRWTMAESNGETYTEEKE